MRVRVRMRGEGEDAGERIRFGFRNRVRRKDETMISIASEGPR